MNLEISGGGKLVGACVSTECSSMYVINAAVAKQCNVIMHTRHCKALPAPASRICHTNYIHDHWYTVLTTSI